MNSTLPHFQPSVKWSYLAPIRTDSRNRPRLGICRARVRQIPRGFTLVEVAIAIFIITLLLGSILVPLATQVEQRQVSETQKMLEDIKEALIGHAIAKGHLPCPDAPAAAAGAVPNDGVEDFDAATGLCYSGAAAGNVPWVTLGLGAMDPWGNRFRYKVTGTYAQRTGTTCTPAPCPPLFNLTTAATLTVSATAGTLLTGINPDGAVAVVFSHGKNGFGAMNALVIPPTLRPEPPAANEDELDNSVGGVGYTSRTHTSVVTPCSDTVAGQPRCEFDDIVTWLGKYTLFNRMVAAGKLP